MTLDRRQIRAVCVAAELALFASSTAAFAARGVGGPGSCGRGPSLTGVFLSREHTPGGGAYLVISRDGSPAAVTVTENVFDAAGSLSPGARVRLVSRNAVHPLSGSGGETFYTCIERAR